MELNRENLQRMADYIRTIPQKNFSMELFRSGGHETHKCQSVGCVLGHCTILDDWNNIPKDDGHIEYWTWMENFTGVEWECHPLSKGMDDFLFGTEWAEYDDTPNGAADRIEWVLNGNFSEDWLFPDFREGWRERLEDKA